MDPIILAYVFLIPIIGTVYLTSFYFSPNRKVLFKLTPVIFFLSLLLISAILSLIYAVIGVSSFTGLTLASVSSIAADDPFGLFFGLLYIIMTTMIVVLSIAFSQFLIIIPGFLIFLFFQKARNTGNRNRELILLILYPVLTGIAAWLWLLNSRL